MQMLQRERDLREVKAGGTLAEDALPPQLQEQLAPRAEIHDDEQLLPGLEGRVHRDDEGVVRDLRQYVPFGEHVLDVGPPSLDETLGYHLHRVYLLGGMTIAHLQDLFCFFSHPACFVFLFFDGEGGGGGECYISDKQWGGGGGGRGAWWGGWV